MLESREHEVGKPQQQDLSLSVAEPTMTPELKEVQSMLESISPDDLTPKQALELLYSLKKQVS